MTQYEVPAKVGTQIRKFLGSFRDRKFTNFLGVSVRKLQIRKLKKVCKFVDLRFFAEVICGPPTFGYLVPVRIWCYWERVKSGEKGLLIPSMPPPPLSRSLLCTLHCTLLVQEQRERMLHEQRERVLIDQRERAERERLIQVPVP